MTKAYVFIAAVFIIVIGMAFWSTIDSNVDNLDVAQGTLAVGVSWAHTPTTTNANYDHWLYRGHTNGTGIVSCRATSLSGIDENVTIGHNSVNYGHVFLSDGSGTMTHAFDSNNDFAAAGGSTLTNSTSTGLTEGSRALNVSLQTAGETYGYARTTNTISHDGETNYSNVRFDVYVEDVDYLLNADHGARFLTYQGSTAFNSYYFQADLVDGQQTIDIDLTSPDATNEVMNLTDITAYRFIFYDSDTANHSVILDNLRLATNDRQSNFTVENIGEFAVNTFDTENTAGNFSMSCVYEKPYTAESGADNLLGILVLLVVVLIIGLLYKLYKEV